MDVLHFYKSFKLLNERKKLIQNNVNLEYTKEYFRLIILIDELLDKCFKNEKISKEVCDYFKKESTVEMRRLFNKNTSYDFEKIIDFNALEMFIDSNILNYKNQV